MFKHKNDRAATLDLKTHNTLRGRANQKLENKFKLASMKVDYLKNSLKNLNHDLRSPLGGIIGMMELLINDNEEKKAIKTSDLLMIKESAQSIFHIMNTALAEDISEISLKEPHKNDKILSSAMMEINRLYLPMAKNKGVLLTLSKKTDNELPLSPKLFANLIQITGNLVGNAIKFTPDKGSVDVLFTMSTIGNKRTLCLAVSDDGGGMSEEQVNSFLEGEIVSRTKGTNGEQSYGIGLKHIKEMVDECDGQVQLESRIGKGTVFFVSFPLPGKTTKPKITSHLSIKNGTVSQNGSLD